MARFIGCLVEQVGAVHAVEAGGSHHTHLGPISEEQVVLKCCDTKWMWRHDSSIEHCFPVEQQHVTQHGQQWGKKVLLMINCC